MSETQIKKAILDMVENEYSSVQVTRHQSGIVLAAHGRRIHLGDPGWPDIIGYLPDGRFIGIEVKAPGAKKQRHEDKQRTRGNHIEASGAVYLRVDSVEAARYGIEKALRANP